MPIPQQLIAESREDFHKRFDPTPQARQGVDLLKEKLILDNNKDILDWHTSTLISLLDALIEEEKAEFMEGTAQMREERDVYNQAKQDTISRLETLKTNIAKTAE